MCVIARIFGSIAKYTTDARVTVVMWLETWDVGSVLPRAPSRAGHVVPTPWAQSFGQGDEQVCHPAPGVGCAGAAQTLGTGAAQGGTMTAAHLRRARVVTHEIFFICVWRPSSTSSGAPLGSESKPISKPCPAFDIPPVSVRTCLRDLLVSKLFFQPIFLGKTST